MTIRLYSDYDGRPVNSVGEYLSEYQKAKDRAMNESLNSRGPAAPANPQPLPRLRDTLKSMERAKQARIDAEISTQRAGEAARAERLAAIKANPSQHIAESMSEMVSPRAARALRKQGKAKARELQAAQEAAAAREAYLASPEFQAASSLVETMQTQPSPALTERAESIKAFLAAGGPLEQVHRDLVDLGRDRAAHFDAVVSECAKARDVTAQQFNDLVAAGRTAIAELALAESHLPTESSDAV